MTSQLHVLAAPTFDPGTGRIELEMPHGLSVAAIVEASLPDLVAEERARLRVALVTSRGSEVLPQAIWHRARPRPGVKIVIRAVPGKGALRSILMIAVTIAAVAIGNVWGPMVAGSLGIGVAGATALVTAGVSIVGSLLLNALVPPVRPENERRRERYTISGWRNRVDPDGAIPVVFGTHRYAPPFAATSWSEIVGDWHYVRAVFVVGYGPLRLSDFRIGGTSIADYDEVEIEVRDGRAGDAPLSLYPRQVIEETIGTELTRPLVRDDAGNVKVGGTGFGGSDPDLGDGSIETPVVRTTATDSEAVSIILTWPAGLVRVNDEGKKRTETVEIRIEQRKADATAWTLVETLTIRGRKIEAFFRQHSWTFPSRGQWQVRLTMMTRETTDMQRQRRTIWVAMQSIRPEYPLALRDPVALVALRIKATHQLSGQLDDVSALVSALCPDYDEEADAWIERVTSNPASLYRHALQSPANPRPVADAGIDLPQLQAWHSFCRQRGLRYDRVIDDAGAKLRDILGEIAAAGRATPRHDGLRWGVTIDRPQALVVDHISPRNSWNFRATRTYARPPDGLRIRFNDRANDYQPAERLVLRPGHTGEIVLTEVLDLPGKTGAEEVWREATRRMLEVEHRPDVFEVMQDGPVRVATRGDLVALSADVLDEVQCAARVVGVRGRELAFDEDLNFAGGQDHAIRFRRLSDGDTIGTSQVRLVSPVPGHANLATVDGTGPLPGPGDLVMFGRAGRETFPAVVIGVEQGEDMACLVRAVPAAPEIDAALEAMQPPPWSPRVGVELPQSALQPPEPRFAGITSGSTGTGEAGRIEVELVPGPGPVPTARYGLRHRKSGATSWNTVYFPAAEGTCILGNYLTGDSVELQAFSLSSSGSAGPATPVITIIVGEADPGLPEALPDTVDVEPLLGAARISFRTGADPAVTAIQLYRSRSPLLDRASDRSGEPVAVDPSRSYAIERGDLTRDNLLASPRLDSAAGWQRGDGWSIAQGVASHEGGEGDLGQRVTIRAGAWYRLAYRLTDVTAGAITPLLTGPSERLGTARAAAGTFVDRLQAVSGHLGLAWRAGNEFAGSLDDVALYEETRTCLGQGTHYFWLEPLNSSGLPGPIAGPFSASII